MIVVSRFRLSALPTIVFATAKFAAATAVTMMLMGSAVSFAQEYRGSSDQQTACTPDVFRLCWSEIPNIPQIIACLKRERPRLSPECRLVFEPSGTRSARNVFRGRRHHASAEHRRARHLSRHERRYEDD